MSKPVVILSHGDRGFLHADYYVDPTDDEDYWALPDGYKTSAKGTDMDAFKAECKKVWPGVKMAVIEESEFGLRLSHLNNDMNAMGDYDE